MTARLDDMAISREFQAAQRAYLFAPRGKRTERLKDLQRVVIEDLKRSAGKKGKRK